MSELRQSGLLILESNLTFNNIIFNFEDVYKKNLKTQKRYELLQEEFEEIKKRSKENV